MANPFAPRPTSQPPPTGGFGAKNLARKAARQAQLQNTVSSSKGMFGAGKQIAPQSFKDRLEAVSVMHIRHNIETIPNGPPA